MAAQFRPDGSVETGTGEPAARLNPDITVPPVERQSSTTNGHRYGHQHTTAGHQSPAGNVADWSEKTSVSPITVVGAAIAAVTGVLVWHRWLRAPVLITRSQK